MQAAPYQQDYKEVHSEKKHYTVSPFGCINLHSFHTMYNINNDWAMMNKIIIVIGPLSGTYSAMLGRISYIDEHTNHRLDWDSAECVI